jgi:hypothetical protein
MSDTTPVDEKAAVALLNSALALVESDRIRAWAQSPHNGPLWLEEARGRVLAGKTDPVRFATIIVVLAMGA